MAVQTSPEQPLPVRSVSQLIGQWIARLGRVWVEGQVTQITRRPGSGVVFLVLRDPHADVSLSVTCSNAVLDALQPPLADGTRVVVHGKPDFYLGRGSLSLNVTEIRPVGLGVLLARLEAAPSHPGRRGAVRRRPQAAAAVPAAYGRLDLRARIRSRARRPRERASAAGRRCASTCAKSPSRVRMR